jgi:hypothetical protein
MSQEIAKSIEKVGTKIDKERLLEMVKKSPAKEFQFTQIPNTKQVAILVKQA